MEELVQTYERDILEYLKTKLPDERISTVMEIASFIDSKTAVLVCNIIRDRDEQWTKQVTARDAQWRSELKELLNFMRKMEKEK